MSCTHGSESSETCPLCSAERAEKVKDSYLLERVNNLEQQLTLVQEQVESLEGVLASYKEKSRTRMTELESRYFQMEDRIRGLEPKRM